MRRLLLLFAPLLSVGACNGDAFSNDAGADSGNDVIVVGGGDSGADGSSVDADSSAPQKRFCESVDAQFCADFDIPNDAGAGFFPPTTTNGYTLTFETNQFKSSPTGAGVFIPGDAGGMADLNAVVPPPDAGTVANITLDVDMYVPNLSATTTQPLFFFAFGSAGPQFQFGLAHDGPVWKLEFVPTKNGPQLGSAFALNEWIHVTLVVVPSNTVGYVTITITSSAGTSMAATGPGQFATAPPGTGPFPMVLDVGANSSAPPIVSAQAYYDNVVVHFQ